MADVTYPCYWERKDNKGQWYWIYYASNGKAISRSSESYVSRSDCDHSITIMKGASGSPTFYTEWELVPGHVAIWATDVPEH